jgi:signal transduction histidine kinase
VRARLLIMVTAVVLAAVVAVGWSSRRVTRAEFRQFVAKLETEVVGDESAGEADAVWRALSSLGNALQRDFHERGDFRGATALLSADSRTLDGRAAILVVDGVDVVAASDPGLRDADVAVHDDGTVEVNGWQRSEGDEVFDAQSLAFRGGPRHIIRTADGAEAAVLYLFPSPETAREGRIAHVIHEEDFLGSLDRWMVGVVMVVGVLALVAAVVVSGRIVGPIEKLTEASRRMGRGELGLRVDVASGDELGELAHAFNSMAASLERNERLRRDMVSDVAHELRTPLTNLRAQLEAVQDGLAEPTVDLVASLHEEAMLLNRLVDDLQELALAEAGQLRLRVEEIDVVAELERAAALFRRSEGSEAASGPPAAKSIEVEVADGSRLPAAAADRQRLRQILSNLIDNAVRHGGGRIVIGARAAASPPPSALSSPDPGRRGFVCITVADHGSGIAPEQLEKVFERFYRTDPARQRTTGGAGLGLAIVRQLVEAQGGCVWAESGPGGGCRFGFCLPAAG